MSNSLLEDYEPTNQEDHAMKFIISKSNSAMMGTCLQPNFTLIQNFVENKVTLNELILQRKQEIDNFNYLEPIVITKIGLIESFSLMREVIHYFAPLMSETNWTINEESLKIPKEIELDPTKEYPLLCLKFTEQIETLISQHLSLDSSFADFNMCYSKGIFYQWIGNQEKAVAAWKGNLQFLFNSSIMNLLPFFLFIPNIFYSIYFLLEAGIIYDPIISTAFSTLTRFSSTYPLANDALQYLLKYKELMEPKVHQEPNIQFNQELTFVQEDWLHSSSNSSSSSSYDASNSSGFSSSSNFHPPDFQADLIPNNFEPDTQTDTFFELFQINFLDSLHGLT